MGKNAIIHPSVMEVLWRCNGCDFRDLAHSPNWSYDMSKERTSETEHVHLFTIDPFDSLGKNGYQTTICEDGKEIVSAVGRTPEQSEAAASAKLDAYDKRHEND